MKILKPVLFIIALFLISCGGGISKQPANAEGFGAIEQEIKNRFGEQSYFTDISISYNESVGNIVSITVTEEPESLKMGEWSHSRGNWTQNSEISVEIPEDTKAADFMFQLSDKINLTKLGELAEKSSQQLINDKDLKKPRLHMAFVKFPDNGDITKAEYVVMLKPENGGTTFTFSYELNGTLINMDY